MKRRFRLSIKITIMVTLFMLCMFLAITPIIVSTITKQSKQSLINQSKSYVILASNPIGTAFITYRDSGTDLLAQRVRKTAELYTAVQNIGIYDVQGKKLFALGEQKQITIDEATVFEPIFDFDNDGFLKRVVYPLIEESGAHRFTLVYDISSTELVTSLNNLKTNVIYAATGALLLTIILLVVLLEITLIRPLNYMSRIALAIKAGQLEQEIKLKRKDEIGDLGTAINSMADTLQADIHKLSEAEKLKSEFLIISSHNLRTPLTVVNGYVDILKTMELDDKAQKYIAQIEAKASELTELTNDMLTIAELEGNSSPKLQLQETDLISMVKDMQEDVSKRCQEKSIKYESQVPDGTLIIKTQPTFVQTAILNLIDNAIKFTPEQGKIALTVQNNTNTVQLQVADTGAGISPDELPKLFTKFHRGTSLMEYQYEGVGLGLYMTKLMLTLLEGTISAQSELGKGSTFTITLPKN